MEVLAEWSSIRCRFSNTEVGRWCSSMSSRFEPLRPGRVLGSMIASADDQHSPSWARPKAGSNGICLVSRILRCVMMHPGTMERGAGSLVYVPESPPSPSTEAIDVSWFRQGWLGQIGTQRQFREVCCRSRLGGWAKCASGCWTCRRLLQQEGLRGCQERGLEAVECR
jgi:hypothetical protein